MSESQDDTRTMREDGTQDDAENMPGGYGPSASVGGKQEPGGLVPPYDGRQTSAPVDDRGTHRDGANAGGATGPRENTEGYSAPSPSDTPGGRTWSPSDEMPATEYDGDDGPPSSQDPDTGPDHYAGTPRGEDQA
ncbi:MAG: hypothetical protein M3O55_06770 [Actinomycetota bacterium]|nr:hypothetical protein [Actinomycetota bacterium]